MVMRTIFFICDFYYHFHHFCVVSIFYQLLLISLFMLFFPLKLHPAEPVDDDDKSKEPAVWNPYDLYDIAIAGSRSDTENAEERFECASVQSERSVTHISISSFILTHHLSVHKFVSETLLDRWASLQSLKLACLSELTFYLCIITSIDGDDDWCYTFMISDHIDIDAFQPAVVNLVKYHNLRQICFEDTQFSNPMEMFISLLRVLIE